MIVRDKYLMTCVLVFMTALLLCATMARAQTPVWMQSITPVSDSGNSGKFLDKAGISFSEVKSCPLPPGQTFYGSQDLCKPSGTDILDSIECLVPNIVTNFESLVSQVFSSMYCSVQEQFKPVLGTVLTLFVIGFGVMFLTGLVELSAKEAVTRLLKLALVWAFATQAQYGLGIAYNFLTNVPKAGMEIALGTLVSDGGTAMTPGDALQQPINIMLPLPRALDSKAKEIDASGTGAVGSSEIMKVFLALSIFMVMLPPVFAIVLGFFIQVIMTFVRTFTAYLLSIGGIAFLLTLSPIFLSFALFKTTYSWFEHWLKYLASFAIQIIIIFSFLALLQLLNPVDFFRKLIQVGYPYEITFGVTYPVDKMKLHMDVPITVRTNLWSVCRDYQINDELLFKQIVLDCPSDWRYNPYCNNYETPGSKPNGATELTYEKAGLEPPSGKSKGDPILLPRITVDQQGVVTKNWIDAPVACWVTDDKEHRPIPQCKTAPAVKGVCPTNDPIRNVIPLMELVQDAHFLKYIVLNVIAFFLLLYVMEAALRNMPSIAKKLSGLEGGESEGAVGYLSSGVRGGPGGGGGAIDFLLKNKASINNFTSNSLGAIRKGWSG